MSDVHATKDMVTGTISNVSDMEHIPITPSSELMLKIEEIPPLDVFYSPQHKAVVRRKRKKRKLENMLSHYAKQLDILWQDPTTDPTKNLIKLSQITGAYTFATIDKASEVQQLLKEKEDQIQVLQQQLQQAKTNNEAQKQLERLQQDFQQMQIGYHSSLFEREKKLQDMQEVHKDDPKLTEFITESISLNDQLL